MYFDGIFVAENYGIDAAVTGITPNADVATLSTLKVGATIANKGSQAINGFKLTYVVQGSMPVVQNFTDVIQPNGEVTVEFDTPADFGTPDKEYLLSVICEATNDENMANNVLQSTFNNIIATLPYKHDIKDRNDYDHWYTPKDEDSRSEYYIHRDKYWTLQVYGTSVNNARLLSRPIYLTKDQQLTVSYTLFTDGKYEDPKCEVYLTKYEDRDDATKGTLLKTYDAITSTKLSDKLSIIVPEDGVYSIMFYNKPTAEGGSNTSMNNFSIMETPQYEGALVQFVAPKANKDEFTDAETITVRVKNNGLKEMSGAKIRLTIDGNVVATEDLPTLAPNVESDYTFAHTPDMTNGAEHTLKAELLWDNDSDTSNNSVSLSCKADLIAPPYSVDMYDNDFDTHWSWTDNNNDGHTFEFEDVYGNIRLSYNKANETIATTDETLYARTLRLTAGKTYKLTGRLSIWPVNGEETTYDATVDLYSIDKQGVRTLCKNISPKATYTSSDGTYVIGFDVPSDGKYAVAFHITKDTETKTKLAVQDMAIQESGDIEMILSSISLPGTTVSGYNKLPYSIRVTNNGLKPVSTMKIKVTSETIGEVSEEINLEEAIEPGKYKNILMTKPLEMNITGEEVVTFELIADGDVVPSNNVVTKTFNYLAPATLPCELPMDDNSGWLVFDNDGDLSKPYYYSWYSSYSFSNSDGSVGDWVMSRTFNAVKNTPYHISFAGRLSGFNASGKVVDLFLVNVADGSKTLCGTVAFDKNNTPTGYSDFAMEAFFKVETDGTYALVFEHQNTLDGSYTTANIAGPVKIEAMTTAPDMKMTAITAPTEAAVFEAPTDVTATYKNAGTVTLQGMTFSLKAGENTYYAYAAGEIAPEAEGTITFNGVDLTAPGEYTLEASAIVNADATPADNTVSSTLMSQFIYNVNVLSIDGPDNGPLGTHEHVVFSLKNEGHGALVDTPVTMTITSTVNSTPVTVTETIPGPIAEGDTYQYTFETESDFSMDATYTVTVSVKLEGDITPDNDTFTASIVSTHEDMDAGVTAVVGPTDRRMTQEEYLIIKVKNYSDIDIYRVPVSAVITLGEEEVATVTGVIPEIAAGTEIEYTFATPVDLMHGGTYTVKAKTTMPNDVDATNDECEGSLLAWIKDCGVSRIISPEASVVEGRHDITIEIKNYGDVPISNIPVYFKLGSNPQAEVYEGEIAPGETAEYTFKSQYNFRSSREYTLTAYTSHPEDENAANDECTLEIKPTSGIGNVYADGAICISTQDGAIIVTTEVASGDVEVYNASGLKVASEAITDNNTVLTVEGGIYVVRVVSGEATAATKVNVR